MRDESSTAVPSVDAVADKGSRTEDATGTVGRSRRESGRPGGDRRASAACPVGPGAEAEAEAESGGGAPRSGPLGTTSELVLPQQVIATGPSEYADGPTYPALSAQERRRIRFGARAALWQASSLKAVRSCGRLIASDVPGVADGAPREVSVRLSPGERPVAGFEGLATCGSVWACPRCSAVIAAERAAAMGEAIRACLDAGGAVYLLTLTLRHQSGDKLAELWDGRDCCTDR